MACSMYVLSWYTNKKSRKILNTKTLKSTPRQILAIYSITYVISDTNMRSFQDMLMIYLIATPCTWNHRVKYLYMGRNLVLLRKKYKKNMFIENYCHKILCILYQRNPFIKLFMLAFMPNDTIKSRISEIPATHSGQLVQLLDIRCLIEILFLCNWNSSENSLCLKVKHQKLTFCFFLEIRHFRFMITISHMMPVLIV